MTSRQPSTITDADLCQELLTLLKQFKANMAEVADAYGLTAMQLAALHAVHEGHLTMGKVALTMHCDASNVTGIVDRLVAMKMITRQENVRDRRVKTLTLTPTGQAILTKVSDELPAGLGCGSLTTDERQALYVGLRRLTRSQQLQVRAD